MTTTTEKTLTKRDFLRAEDFLQRAKKAYDKGEPIMQDSDYDVLFQRHRATAAAHPEWVPEGSVLGVVGSPAALQDGFVKVTHRVPMLSIDNVFELEGENPYEELEAWYAKTVKDLGHHTYITCEPKIDGLALTLLFRNGKLAYAATRGDGTTGDDVTLNALAAFPYLAGIDLARVWEQLLPGVEPTPIPDLEIRGEVYIALSDFARMNAEREEQGLELWANPRNAAAGALKLRDPAEVAKRGLSFIAHGLAVPDSKWGVESTFDFERLMRMYVGIPCTTDWSMTSAPEAPKAAVEEWRVRLKDPEWDIPYDGLVFKLRHWNERERLGMATRYPRWAIAFKFLPQQATAYLENIEVQVGRTGVLTPVAILKPVLIDGSTVSRATLHNEDQVRRLGISHARNADGSLHGSCHVTLQKAGAIIPEIVACDEFEFRKARLLELYGANPDGRYYVPPEQLDAKVEETMVAENYRNWSLLNHINHQCPSCGSPDIERAEGEVAYRCVNPGCTAQLATKIRHFAGRKMLDIDMLGEEVANAIARMQDVLAVRDVLDLFHLTVADLAPLELNQDGDNVVVVGTARARKIVAGLEKAKTLPLHRWLYAIGIRTVGENTSKELSRLFRSFDEIVHHCQPGGIIHAVRHGADKASEEFAPYRISTHLGPVSAQRLMEFQQSKFGVSFAGFMERFAVVSDNHDPQPTASDAKPLVGMTFVITGTLSVDRDTMKAEIERAGGKVSGSVSKTTKYLIAGEGGGQKRKKAAALGVETIDEAGIRAMLP